MLYWMCAKSEKPPTEPQLKHAIQRNFGGLEADGLVPMKVFWKKIPLDVIQPLDLAHTPEEVGNVSLHDI